MHKLLALILSLLLTCSCLTGCGPKKTEQAQKGMELQPSKYAFELTLEPLEVKEKILSINGFAGRDNVAYLCAAVSRENRMEDVLYRLDLTTGDMKAMELPQEPDVSSSVASMTVDADGTIWMMRQKQKTTWALPEGMTQEDPDAWQYQTMENLGTSLCHLDGEGTVLEEAPVELPENVFLHQLIKDDQNRFYCNDFENVYVLDSQGHTIKQFPVEGIENLILLRPDTVGVRAYSATEERPVVSVLDTEAGTVGKELPVPESAWRFYPGMDGYDFLYLDGQSVMGAKVDGEWKPERLFSWLDCNVNPDTFREFVFREDGAIVGLEGSGRVAAEEENQYQLVTLTPADPANRPEVQELTLACVGLDFNFKPMIVDFNRTHPTVRITVKDYNEGIDPSTQAGFARLTTEMMAGTLPDLLLTRGMPMDRLGSAGILEDLWPFLERDVGRDKLMTHVLDVMSQDGKLYYLTDGFGIMTATCDKAYTGEKTSWTVPELLEALNTLKPGADLFEEGITKKNALYYFSNMGLSDLVDWETGTCSFDSPQFVELLQLTDRFPLEFDWENYDYADQEDAMVRMRAGKQLMHSCIIENIYEYMQELSLYEDGQAVFVGYPTDSGSGSAFALNAGLAMTTACKDKEAAWDFIAMLLEESPMSRASFSIDRSIFESQFADMMTKDYIEDPETGEQVEDAKDVSRYGDHAPIYAMTQEQYDLFMEVYENCQTVDSSNDDILKLVMDEAAAYFAGQKTAEETAKLIQNRVSLYLQEQAS